MTFLLIQLYWISFFVIGISLLISIKSLKTPKSFRIQQQIKQVIDLNPITALIFSFITGILVFMPLVTIGYILEAPLEPYILFYIAMLIWSFYVLVKNRSSIGDFIQIRLPKPISHRLLVIFAALTLLHDFIITIILGSTFEWDAPVHISRINSLVNVGLSIADPYLGNNGVVDPRYSANLMGFLQGLASTMLNVPATDTWSYSAPFYRLIIWLCVFIFLWFVVTGRHKFQLSLSLLIIIPFLWDAQFHNALFPDRIVYAWTALFFVGVILWARDRNPLLMLMSAGLIAVTHPINSLMALIFLTIYTLLLLFVKKAKIKYTLPVLISSVLLCIPVFANLYYPNRTELSSAAFNAGVISGTPVTYARYGSMYVHQINIPFGAVTVAATIVLILYAIIIPRIANNLLRKITIIIWAFASLFMYSPLIFSIVGYVFLLIKNKSAYIRIMIILLAVFYGLLIYNPVLITAVHDQTPPWIIGRVQEFNLLSLVMPCIGIYAWFLYILKQLGISRDSIIATITYPVAAVLLVSSWPTLISINSLKDVYMHKTRTQAFYSEHEKREVYASRIKTLSNYINGNVVLTSSNETMFIVPMVSSANVLSLLHTNYSPMANIPMRERCHQSLIDILSYDDLSSAGINYIVVDLENPKEKSFRQLVESKAAYLSLVTENRGLRLYKFENKTNIQKSDSICEIPYRQ